jgi:4-hydroxy-4-methyl-2-oxoglutarate aldolase
VTQLEELARLGVATVHEAQGKTGLVDIPLVQVVPGSRVAGRARTARCANGDNLMVHAAVADAEPGDVLVLTMPDPMPVAMVGDLLATQALDQGVVAILVDGAVRDVDELRELGLPIWTRYVRAQGAAKEQVGELDTPVVVGGARIARGDVVVLDADGAVVVEAGRVDEVVAAAREREARERDLRARYAAGERSYDVNDLRRLVEGQRPA